MEFWDFPHCCTADILVGFSGTSTALSTVHGVPPATTKDVVEHVVAYFSGRVTGAMLCATTNNEQKAVNKAFRLLGFDHTKWQSKLTHANTKVRFWWVSVEDVTPERIAEWRMLLSNMEETDNDI